MLEYRITHELPGRMRIRYGNYAFSNEIAQGLRYEILSWPMVNDVEINDITGSILFHYDSERRNLLIELLNMIDVQHFDITPWKKKIDGDHLIVEQERAKSRYLGDFVKILAQRFVMRWLMPGRIRQFGAMFMSLKYLKEGIKCIIQGKIAVPMLDAASILVSMLQGDFNTAGNIMFLLKTSELLQDYTKEKATIDLKNSLSLKVDRVWVLDNDREMEIPMSELNKGDIVIIRTGSMVPIDGEIIKGEAMINESSFTGEPLSKPVEENDTVFAGTIVEEGKIYVRVRNLQQDSRISLIVDMINTNESLKAEVQARAEHLADAIVPYSFLGFFFVLLTTGNVTRATSVLMVDYSCAIKLSTSISIISAMNEASHHDIMIKGGKYLEAMADADTIVFDKTGTLTNAQPVVQKVYSLDKRYSVKDVLMIAACLEEHFPHSMAKAIVNEAKKRGYDHPESHADVEYIIAHGLASRINKKRVIIGSSHFVFEDEEVPLTDETRQLIEDIYASGAGSMLYLAVERRLIGVISIYDPVKDEVKDVIDGLRERNVDHIIMMTGDGNHAAAAISAQVGISEYYAHVLPEDKAACIFKLKEEGHKVVMIGDGVNDTPALSAANVSVSMHDSSDIARELADITLMSEDLTNLLLLRDISKLSMERIKTNYRYIVGFNSSLIILGALGVFGPSLSAFLHNASTIFFTAFSTRPLIIRKKDQLNN